MARGAAGTNLLLHSLAACFLSSDWAQVVVSQLLNHFNLSWQCLIFASSTSGETSLFLAILPHFSSSSASTYSLLSTFPA